ncbi:MAG: hypothetical protein WA005_04995 [Candidatus Binataceae bacterium]
MTAFTAVLKALHGLEPTQRARVLSAASRVQQALDLYLRGRCEDANVG